MNWGRIEGQWKQMKGRVREQWGGLTDDDVDRVGGKRDALVGRIQEQYGITRAEAVVRGVEGWSGWSTGSPQQRRHHKGKAGPRKAARSRTGVDLVPVAAQPGGFNTPGPVAR